MRASVDSAPWFSLRPSRSSPPPPVRSSALCWRLWPPRPAAVDNARLYENSRRRQGWSDAAAELTRGLLSSVDVTAVLTVFAERIAAMAGGTAAVILLPGATRTVLSR